jgi:hypothetical protein
VRERKQDIPLGTLGKFKKGQVTNYKLPKRKEIEKLPERSERERARTLEKDWKQSKRNGE